MPRPTRGPSATRETSTAPLPLVTFKLVSRTFRQGRDAAAGREEQSRGRAPLAPRAARAGGSFADGRLRGRGRLPTGDGRARGGRPEAPAVGAGGLVRGRTRGAGD